MFRVVFTLLITSFVFSCQNNVQPAPLSRNHHRDTTLRVLTYGLPDLARMRAENVVAKKYGIEYYPVAGCVISEELVDSVKKENKKVYDKLSDEYGKNWKVVFAEEVAAMKQRQQEAEEIVKKEPYIIKLEAALKKDNNYLEYFIEPSKQEDVLFVEVYRWVTRNDQSTPETYYKLSVDLTKKKVIKITDNRKVI